MAFCLMIQAGLPAEEAIVYFVPESADKTQQMELLAQFQRSRLVAAAQRTLMGRDWTEMSLDERIKYALDQHYSSLAYLLFSQNYITSSAAEKSKMDSARTTLEAKLAGLAGKTDAMSRFFDDISTGKLKLTPKEPNTMH